MIVDKDGVDGILIRLSVEHGTVLGGPRDHVINSRHINLDVGAVRVR